MIYALLVTGLFAACKKDDIGKAPEEQKTDQVNFRFTATNGGPSFRTGHTAEDDKLSVSWLTGDKIGLFSVVNNDTKNANTAFSIKAASDITNSGKNAVFSGELAQSADWDMDFYAYYPHAALETADVKKIPVSLADQAIDGKDSKHLAKYDILVADPLKGVKAGAENTQLNFKHVMAIADLKISLPTGAEAQQIKQIRFQRADGKLIGVNGTLDISAATEADRLKITSTEAEQLWTQKTKVENVSLAAGESFQAQIAMLPADWSSETISIYVDTDKGTYQFDKTNIKTEAGKRYTSELKLENKLVAKVGDFYYADGSWSTDLDSKKKVVGVVVYTGQKGGATNGFVAALEDVSNGQFGKLSLFNIPEIPGATWTGVQSGEEEDWDGQAHAKAVAAKRTEEGYKDMNFILLSLDYAPTGITSGPAAKGNWYTPAINQLSVAVMNNSDAIEASLLHVGGTTMKAKNILSSTETYYTNSQLNNAKREVLGTSNGAIPTGAVANAGSFRIDARQVFPVRPFLTF